MDFKLATTEGFQESWVLKIADVNKPLGAVVSRVDQVQGGLRQGHGYGTGPVVHPARAQQEGHEDAT